MNLHTETTVHDDMYSMKYSQTDILDKPMLFELFKQIRLSHAM